MVQRKHGGLAQLARAPALHAGGQRFDSVILHIIFEWSVIASVIIIRYYGRVRPALLIVIFLIWFVAR